MRTIRCLSLTIFIFLSLPVSMYASGIGIEGYLLLSQHRVYDNSFTAEESYNMFCWTALSPENCTTTISKIQFDGNDYTLTHLPAWDSYYKDSYLYFEREFNEPPPGPAWESKDYKFSAICEAESLSISVSTHLNPEYGTYNKIGIPSTIDINLGSSLNLQWSRVSGASSYSIKMFALNASGNPDTSKLLFNSGDLTTVSYTLTSFSNLDAGDYALCIESRDYLDDNLLNRSQYFTKITKTEESNYQAGDYNYYIPYFRSGNDFWTGLGLTNRNQREASQLQVTVYDVSGNLLATENKTIPAHGQDSFAVTAHLNNNGWMQVNSHQPLSGLAFLGSGNIPLLMADIPFSSELSSCLIIPHIAQDGSWDTTILICNPNNKTASIAIKYVDRAGIEQGTKNYIIPANGSGKYLLSTVFSDRIPLEGSIEISSSHGITAFALYTDKKNGGTYYAGINAESCE